MKEKQQHRKKQLQAMRGRRKGGQKAKEDGFDRRDEYTFASLIDEWLQKLKERNYSEHTVNVNKWALRNFLTWAQERELHYPTEATKPLLERYQRWLYHYRKRNDKPLSVMSQRNRLETLKRFFSYLCKENYLLANPASDLELPRKKYQALPKALSREEIEDLMGLPDITDPLGIRNRTILEVFYSTGIRRLELTSLNIEDVSLPENVLTVRRGKGGKPRLVPLGKRAVLWLGKYLESSRDKLLVSLSEKALFLSGYGDRFNTHYLGNWVHQQIKKVCGDDKWGACHLLRHSCATHMLENGADIRFIQQILGHEKLDTTKIYTEVEISHLKKVHSETHPHA